MVCLLTSHKVLQNDTQPVDATRLDSLACVLHCYTKRVMAEAQEQSILVEIDGVSELGKGLHRGAITAPEAMQGTAPAMAVLPLALPCPQGQ